MDTFFKNSNPHKVLDVVQLMELLKLNLLEKIIIEVIHDTFEGLL